MAKSPADQQIEDDENKLNQDVAAVESTEAPASDAPAADAAPVDSPAPAEGESPSEDASEPAEEAPAAPADNPAPADAPATDPVAPAPTADAADQAVAADEAQLATDQAADASEDATQPDLTPAQEAAPQVSNGPGQIDGSGILQQTNQEVIDNLPKNDNGQVVIDGNGQILGLDAANQPSPQPGSQA